MVHSFKAYRVAGYRATLLILNSMRERIARALIRLAHRLDKRVEPIQAHNVIVTNESKAIILKTRTRLEAYPEPLKTANVYEFQKQKAKDKLMQDAQSYIQQEITPSGDLELRLIIFKQ